MRTLIAGMLTLFIGAGCASAGSAPDEAPSDRPPEGGSTADAEQSSESTGGGREDPPEGYSDAEVLDVITTIGGRAVLLTKSPAKSAEVVVPIFIGRSQAHVIELRLERRRSSRPLTHDLLDTLVDRLGGEIRKVHIGAIKSGVFVGTVFVESDGTTIEVDSRSSDAIALALGNRVPIFVADTVFEKAGISKKQFERRGLDRGPNSPGRPRERREREGGSEKEGESSGEGPFL